MKAQAGTIVIIGAGKVATALAQSLSAGRKIVQVYSHSAAHAKELGNVLKCAYTNDLKKIIPTADIYIIAVKDDAIEKVASILRLKDKTVVHTSGSVDVKVLKKVSDNYGVLYPLQTFSAGGKLKAEVPFCIEASGSVVKKQLSALVKELGGKAYDINSGQRAQLHLAAVFANNFTNHIFAAAYNLMTEAGMPFDILLPLIEETIRKLKKTNPALNQTGPAVRNDRETIKKHTQLLKNNPQYLALYQLMTKSIQQTSRYAAKKF